MPEPTMEQRIVQLRKQEVRDCATELAIYLIRNLDSVHDLRQEMRLRCEHMIMKITEYQLERAYYESQQPVKEITARIQTLDNGRLTID